MPRSENRHAASPEGALDIAVDARPLQDPRYRYRGIGQFISTLLSARSAGPQNMRLIGAIDPTSEPLQPIHASLFDCVQAAGTLSTDVSALLSTSPMTHSPLPFARLLKGKCVRAALVYDFIPNDFPEIYLSQPEHAIEYAARLLWLRSHDRYYAISDYTRQRLLDVSGVDDQQVLVTGIPLRAGLQPHEGRASSRVSPTRTILLAGGDDWRKNADVVLAAHARSALLARNDVTLTVFGGYAGEAQTRMRHLYGSFGGNQDLLRFASDLEDNDLQALYASAIVTVVPSRAEGFSMPVLEAASNSCPVLAADIPAHREVLASSSDLFLPDDVTELQFRIEQLLSDKSAADAIRSRQASISARYDAVRITTLFWRDFGRAALSGRSRPLNKVSIGHKARPAIAFVTPVPPDKSGVADYSAATLAELSKLAKVTVFTNTQQPRLSDLECEEWHPLSPMAYISNKYDATVSVLGNSHFHLDIFNLMRNWGGSSIAHDARMINFYHELLGVDHAIAVASREVGRPVDGSEIRMWMTDQRTLPALFMSEIAELSRPMFVHSKLSQSILADRGIPSVALPFAPYRVLSEAELTPAGRLDARHRLRLPERRVLIATFGEVGSDRAILDCIWSIEMLKSWNFDVMLACIGPVEANFERYLRNMAQSIGVADRLVLTPKGVSEKIYRLWLRAADIGIQLRTSKIGGLSGALLDCIAAGLPTVANSHLFHAMDAPDYVHSIPDGVSAVLLAEKLALAIEHNEHRERPLTKRRQVLAERGQEAYARSLLRNLGLEADGGRN